MKKFLTSLSLKARIALCTLMVMFTAGPAFAQDDPLGSAILDGTQQGIVGMIPRIMNVLKGITIFAGGIALLMVIINIIGGERDSAKKAGWWLIGMVLGFIVFTLLGNAAANIV